MRKRNTVKIDDKKFTVMELTVEDILHIYDEFGETGISSFVTQVKNLLPKATDATIDDLKRMAPSEIKQIYDAFIEVNSAFFDLARSLGLGEFLVKLKQALLTDFSALFADLSKPDIPGSGNTDTLSS